MKKRIIKKCNIFIIILLFFGLIIVPYSESKIITKLIILTNSSNTLYVGGSGQGNYSTIQGAIDDANPDDTVYVYSGTYYEHVVVDKTINLFGESRDNTIIDGTGINYVIKILADFVMINNFTIQNGRWCIRIHSSSNNIFGNNIFGNDDYPGLIISHASYNNIYDNKLNNVTDGIRLEENSSYNKISCNDIKYSGISIVLMYSTYNNILKNNIYAHNRSSAGIRVSFSSHNNVNDNIIDNVGDGIGLWDSSWNNISGNYINKIFYGIGLVLSSYNNISGNDIYGNNIQDEGITLSGSFNNYISGNNIQNNNEGITISSLANCIISGNNIQNNNLGIYIYYSNNINLTKNNLINNNLNAFFKKSFEDESLWNNNYWYDRRGIGPKIINGKIKFNFLPEFEIPWINIDWHPAKEPFNIE